MIYTGVGSRRTPDDVLALMERFATRLSEEGWTLRSGCAPGADTAFELASGWRHELYLPWPNFEGRGNYLVRLTEPSKQAMEVAALFHPYWSGLSPEARKLHARNVHQVLGPDLGHIVVSRFVLCWTPGGQGGGGTGQALRIARAYDVPVFDLGRDDAESRIVRWLGWPGSWNPSTYD